MPLKKHILGRYNFVLWAKLNFPLLTEKGSMYHLTFLIKQYEKYQRNLLANLKQKCQRYLTLQNLMGVAVRGGQEAV